ncbi:MAG: MMPL family transporter [Candidatus Thalassarchaeaceae archaeon]|nr:MMPL family transporter [Candidatus Thalassarchaeaceae archaeon]MDP7042672.1 MMPL family transporter [Candidatus Thalassarchaeaceae archaeon]
MENISDRENDDDVLPKAPTKQLTDKILATTDKVKEKLGDIDADNAVGVILAAPRRLKKELRKMSVIGTLTRFPAPTVAICLLITMFFLFHSGILDKWTGTTSLNVNGDLEVYLPDDSRVKDDIATIEEDWTTNAMIIYVESENQGVTNVEILKQFDLIERQLNKVVSDGGQEDGIIYILSISTVVKEVNSSAPRVAKAFVTNALGDEDLAQQINEQIDDLGDTLGGYSIPDDQNRVNQIIGELPPNAKDKLYRDVGAGALDQVGFPNRGVIVVGVVDTGFHASEIAEVCKTGGQREAEAYTDIITYTECWIEQNAFENNWNEEQAGCEDRPDGQNGTAPQCLGLTMTLTGPVPITNSVTKYSFVLFWQIFPLGIIAVALGLFLFHSDLIQTGRVRIIQGIKVVIISGLPTLCSVWWTLGIIGYLDYEVTMTVIIVGPILLALGVSYGLHITNRYAEESGTPEDKMAIALQSTGKAVLLSAITTVIGFISLVSTPMAPIKTVGIALAGGIVVVYILTMVMVPNLTMLLDLKKPSHPPPKIIEFVVEQPINWSKITLSIFVILMLTSAFWARPLVEENIDLLDMAPEGQPPILKMKQYSQEFNAGQIGMLLVDGAIAGDRDDDSTENDDPFAKLQDIEMLENRTDRVDRTNAISIVFLMKSVGVSVNLSGTSVLPFCDIIGGTGEEVCHVIFDREQDQDATFWKVLSTFNTEDDANKRVQIFLLDVFYASLTQETRQLFINETFQRSLIYIDMPFMNVKETQTAVDEINIYAEQSYPGGISSSPLIGVAAVTIAVNELIVGSQWTSLGFALIATLFTLAVVFRDPRFALLTTLPVVFTVAMQWLVMQQMDVTLSLVTVMIGSILVGVGIDFSIHIANRIREQGGTIEAVREACTTTGMSLIEAVFVTCLGLATAFFIPIPALKPFVLTIIILLIVAASSALLLLPAIFTFLIESGVGLVGGSASMMRAARLIAKGEDEEVVLAAPTQRTDHDSW